MKTNFLVRICLSAMMAFISLCAFAQVEVQGPICIPGDPAISSGPYSLNSTNISNLTWSVEGDLVIDGPNNSAMVKVKPFAREGGRSHLGKGRITASYIDLSMGSVCGQQKAFIDVFKIFAPTSDLIVGPNCVSPGEIVTYSIKDIVSNNLDQNIGIDLYKWTLPDPTWQTLYYSGDKSSITFKVGTVSASNVLKVDIGQCNYSDGLDYQKNIGSKTPKPVYTSKPASCLPTTENTATITVNPVSGVNYSWKIINNSTWYPTATTANSITINVGTTAGKVVLASGGSSACDTHYDTITINRTLGTNITLTGPSCVEPNTLYTFYLNPTTNQQMNWVAPAGWNIDPNTKNGEIILVRTGPTPSSGTISARPLDACTTAARTRTVNVKPGNPGTITGPTCLNLGSTAPITFSVAPVVPAAGNYLWTLPTGWTGTSKTNTITVTPNGTTAGTISVKAFAGTTPTGTCSSAVSTLNVQYKPSTPTAILRSPASCISSGVKGTLTLTVDPIVAGQTYEWNVPSGLGTFTPSNANASSIVIATSGVNGTYTVTVNGKNSCGVGGAISENITIAPNSAQLIAINDPNGDIFFVSNAPFPSTYIWYSLDPVTNIESVIGTGFSINLSGSLTRTIYVDVTSGGCTTRLYTSTTRANQRVAAPSESEISAYPNPNQGSFKITIPAFMKKAEYTLFNESGKSVGKNKLKQGENGVSMNNLKNGLYTMIINIDGTSVTKKIQVIK